MRTPKYLTLLGSILLAASMLIVFTPGAGTAFAAAKQVNAPLSPCNTKSSNVNGKDAVGVILFSFKMTTHWCWNGKIVTSHKTTAVANVTSPGATLGWHIQDISSIHFECYVASGSKLQCSGNREQASADFHDNLTSQTCHTSITQSENYKGQFFQAGTIKC